MVKCLSDKIRIGAIMKGLSSFITKGNNRVFFCPYLVVKKIKRLSLASLRIFLSERMMPLLSSSRVQSRTRVFVWVSRHSKNVPGTSQEGRSDGEMIVKKGIDGKVSWWSYSACRRSFLIDSGIRVLILLNFCLWSYWRWRLWSYCRRWSSKRKRKMYSCIRNLLILLTYKINNEGWWRLKF